MCFVGDQIKIKQGSCGMADGGVFFYWCEDHNIEFRF